MKTILLVDDEFPARQLLKSMLDWSQTGFEIAYEAKNGAEALHLFQTYHPDLIISDIQMPVMDGLELLSNIRRENQKQLFIVLSCYERFDYARQVIQLGGLDYLIKDTLTPEILYTALQQARERLEPALLPPDMLPTVQIKDNPYDQILSNWVQSGETMQAVKELSMLGPIRRYMMVSIETHPIQIESLKITLTQISDLPVQCGCCYSPSGKPLIFVNFLDENSINEFSLRYRLLHGIKSILETLLSLPVTFGVSAIHTELSELEQARLESEDALCYQLFMGQGNILYFNPLQNESYSVYQRQLEIKIDHLRSAIARNDLPAVEDILNKLYDTEFYGVMHLNYLEYLNTILWGILTMEYMLRGQRVLPDEALKHQNLSDFFAQARVEDMKHRYITLFSNLIQLEQSRNDHEYSQRVRHIIQYISENFQSDISLDTIATEFQIHKAHLARIFKEETGVSIHEFIRQKRIEMAKELLLNSQYRINEVVYKVGFKNPQNFYTLFTRYVGLTPKDFRNKYG